MNSFFKTLLAGLGAYKWGSGIIGTLLVFIVIYFLLGQCS
jgi:hypothetical protein